MSSLRKRRYKKRRRQLSSFFLVLSLILFSILGIYLFIQSYGPSTSKTKTPDKWQIRSIDTMKNSRDLARLKLDDRGYDREIDSQISKIALTGANYVAIGTPYDEEFIPYLRRWVQAARRHGLNVWFRGNFAGWEGWFDYPKIDKPTHTQKTKQFIENNPYLFENGDIFTSCPECENGLKLQHDPKSISEHRTFLIEQYNVSKQAFESIGKNVKTGYFSMNGDLARAVMDQETTRAVGGVVVVDHYVKSPKQLANDIQDFANRSKAKVMLGEFGAPIPDIHGKMTENEQNEWISEALMQIADIPDLIGLNYWVNTGGTTALWTETGREKPVVKTLRDYYLFFKGS
jgi:hypothetical protein